MVTASCSKLYDTALYLYREELAFREENKLVRDFISSRKISEKSINTFQVGLAHATTLLDSSLGENTDFLLKVGFLSQRGEDKYERFRYRLMFPIFTQHGKIAGFIGRSLVAGPAKWYTLPESEFFDKHSLLFNIDKAKTEITTKNLGILVEGPTDTMTMVAFGFGVTTAMLGTKLSDQQAFTLGRYCSRAVLITDGDKAGVGAAKAIVEKLRRFRVKTVPVEMPEGEDPDSFLHAKGSIEMFRLLKEATSSWR